MGKIQSIIIDTIRPSKDKALLILVAKAGLGFSHTVRQYCVAFHFEKRKNILAQYITPLNVHTCRIGIVFFAFGDTRRVAAVGRDKTTPNSYPERDLFERSQWHPIKAGPLPTFTGTLH